MDKYYDLSKILITVKGEEISLLEYRIQTEAKIKNLEDRIKKIESYMYNVASFDLTITHNDSDGYLENIDFDI